MTDYTLQQLNELEAAEFIHALGAIYEHSPWVAERVLKLRPFDSLQDLQQKMFDQVKAATREQQSRLILNHPELAGREAQQGSLTRESSHEQAAAGLDQCSAEELNRLQTLNARYRQTFGFPFIIAVKGLSRYDIMDAIEQRLHNPPEQEFDGCLQQIGRIADFRLQQQVSE